MAGLQRGHRVDFVPGTPTFWKKLVGEIPEGGIEVARQVSVDEVQLKVETGHIGVPSRFVKLVGGKPKSLFED